MRELSDQGTDIWSKIPETIAIAVFVGGAESVLLCLIPLTFNDGHKIWVWNRLAWLALALPASFLFFHTLINRDASVQDLSQQTNAVAMVGICAGFLALSLVIWLYFRVRRGEAA